MVSLKSKLDKNHLDVLEQIGKSNKEFLKRIILKCNNNKVNKQYSPELRSFALTLHYYSPKAYDYVRKKFDCILPHPKTLYKWYTSINGNPGFNSEALKSIEERCKFVNYFLFGAVIFDEMDIKSEVERVGSKMYGLVDFGGMEKYIAIDDPNKLAKQVLVFTVVCINGSWKIPFGYFFIDSLKADAKKFLILKSLELLHASGIFITSLTFDGAAVNMSIMKQLTGFYIDKEYQNNNLQTYFLHPVTEKKVFIFLDPSHMLKLVRNCLGDFRTIIAEDGEVSWKYFEQLHTIQEKEGLHLANKLRCKHLNYRKQKMKVRLAAQLFSNSVADSMTVLKNMNISLFKDSIATIRFINLFNDLFDIMNSKSLKSSHFKKPLQYSKENENQQNHNNIIFEKLLECEKYILNLETKNSEKLIFSKRKVGFVGFLICIYSLQQLYHELCENEKVLKYIPSYKMSQDHIELLYGCIRAHNGCNNNPTVRQFVGIFKKILVHHELRTDNTGNCIPQENISILHITSKIDPVNVINMTTPSIQHVLPEINNNKEDGSIIDKNIDRDTERLLTLIKNFDTLICNTSMHCIRDC
ncbi:THAP domain-containing protein 9 [Cyphomyrmex costatus]|uniref:THAP domain-containing protein 9 n=1 Tax=Cyphomyrmex costatus TaxID=456900 RepID=A0A151IJP2_9HYME|nr:THAP domain-containing protein 9 [Cyphomyrmex costatus]